jgi:hypothetical protein
MTVNEALQLLELTLPVSHDDVRLAFRKMAKRFHPDLFSEIKSQQAASLKFIEAKKASDYLLKLPVEAINNIRKRPLADQTIKRQRTARAPAPAPVVVSPLVKELDNIARLFHFINEQGKETKWWSKLLKFNFSPGEIVGKWYEVLIEKTYTGEKNLGVVGFALFRFFRILFGTIVLIMGMLLMSIGGLMAAIVLLPSFGIFYFCYYFYNQYLERVSLELNKMIIPNNFNSWKIAKSTYLKYRITPMILFISLAVAFVFVSRFGTFLVNSIALFYSLMVLLLCLSIFSEYLLFKKSVRKRNAEFTNV